MQPSQNTKKADTSEKRSSWFQTIDRKALGIKVMLMGIFYLVLALGKVLLNDTSTWPSWAVGPMIVVWIGWCIGGLL